MSDEEVKELVFYPHPTRSKLSREQMDEIRRKYKESNYKISHRELGLEYGVSRATITKIINIGIFGFDAWYCK